jgi:regulatory protein
MRKNTAPLTPDEILARMEHYCAYRERSPREVRQKLRELGARGEEADQIWQALAADHYFDETRFAEAFAGGKFRVNHWGKTRIRLELLARGIPEGVAEAALDTIPEADYTAILQDLIARKQTAYAADEHPRDKIIAALLRKGFELELIFRYL